MSLIALLWNEVQKHGCQLSSPPQALENPKAGLVCRFMHVTLFASQGKHDEDPSGAPSPSG